jgi:hypothetical protein
MERRFRQPGDFPGVSLTMRLMPAILFYALAIVSASLLGSRWGHHALAGEYPPLNGSSGAAASPGNAPSVPAYFDSTALERGGERWLPDALFQGEPVHDHQHVDVPEPLLFDLVRPLGARKGQLEFNTLAIFPWSASNSNPDDDPFGSSPTTFDKGGIEWAPEVEYAIADNFAIEFEFPFESSTLEEYKLGLQWTIGTAFDNHYIHGFQVLIQPTSEWENWNSTLLYLGGVRFDETWSALLMVGGRMDLEGPNNSGTFERLINASIFADINDSARMGLETNYASKVDGTAEFILVPQVHYQFTDNFQVQSGLGFGAFSEGSEQSFILRVIYSN